MRGAGSLAGGLQHASMLAAGKTVYARLGSRHNHWIRLSSAERGRYLCGTNFAQLPRLHGLAPIIAVMGIYDRDYERNGGYGHEPGIRLDGPRTLTTNLVVKRSSPKMR